MAEAEMLNDLEREVISRFLVGDSPVLESLRTQARDCRVKARELTGVGFFARLSVSAESPLAPLPSALVRLGDVIGEIDGLPHGAGFLLTISDGRLDELEGYSYEEPWPDHIGRFRLLYRLVRTDPITLNAGDSQD